MTSRALSINTVVIGQQVSVARWILNDRDVVATDSMSIVVSSYLNSNWYNDYVHYIVC